MQHFSMQVVRRGWVRRVSFCAWGALACWLAAVPLVAESRLIFPRLSYDKVTPPAGGATLDTFTGLAFVNPTKTPTTVTLRAYGHDGRLLTGAGFQNPATLDVGAERQEAKTAAEIFKASLPPDRVGWVEATSPVAGITGFFLFLTGNLGQLDGADLPEPAEQIVFNQVISEGDYSTELNVVNPGTSEVEVSYKLFGEGISQITRTHKIPGKGVLRHDAGQLFGLARIPAGAHVRVASNGPIAGFEFVRNRRGDLVGTNAVPERSQLGELYFPQMAVLGPWKTELGLTNLSNSPVIVTATAYKGDGTLYTAPNLKTNPVNRTIERQSSVRWDVAELLGFSGSQTFDGWIKVTATANSVSGYVVYGLPQTGASALVAAAAVGRRTALFSHVATLKDVFFTGVALLNPGSLAANVRVMAFGKDGKSLGSFDTVIPPGNRVSKLIDELIGGAANRGDGFIWIKSDAPVYATSLFGTYTLSSLANIPPQAALETFRPDQGIQTMTLTPQLLTVQPDKTSRFTVSNSPGGTLTWKVNGIVRGNSTVGTIDAQGNYKAPAQIPSVPVAVSAEVGNRSAGASVDVLRKDDLFSGLGVVQAVTYLEAAQRLYQTELTASAGDYPGQPVPAASGSNLYELVPQVGPTLLSSLAGKEVVDMAAWKSSSNKEFLLLASKNTGEILRYDPAARQATQVAKGLVQPTALVVDRVSGNLLVAEQDRITTVQKSALESGLRPAPSEVRRRVDPHKPRTQTLVPQAVADGLVVDDCTGDVYFSNRQAGTISVFRRGGVEVEVVANELFGPTALLAVYRRGVSCPAALNLLVIEEDGNWVSLVTPEDGFIYGWFEIPDAFEVEFLPEDNPFFPGDAGVLVGEFSNNEGELYFFYLPYAYDPVPTNLLLQRYCQGSIYLGDPYLELAIRQNLGLQPGDILKCEFAERLTSLVAFESDIEFLDGLEFFPYLRELHLYSNWVFDLWPLSGLVNLEYLDLDDNIVFDLEPLAGLYYIRELWLADNFISDLNPLWEMWDLEVLDLSNNLIDDISPLSLHLGIGEGDQVDLTQNLLDLDDCRDIQQQRIQGAEVYFDVPCEAELEDADIWITVEAPQQVSEFEVLTYNYTLRNSTLYSNYDATELLFITVLPEQSVFLDVDTGGYGECELFEDIVVACFFDSLELDTRLDMSIDVLVWGLAGTTMSNVTLLSASQWDNYPSDNKAVVETAIVP